MKGNEICVNRALQKENHQATATNNRIRHKDIFDKSLALPCRISVENEIQPVHSKSRSINQPNGGRRGKGFEIERFLWMICPSMRDNHWPNEISLEWVKGIRSPFRAVFLRLGKFTKPSRSNWFHGSWFYPVIGIVKCGLSHSTLRRDERDNFVMISHKETGVLFLWHKIIPVSVWIQFN